MRRIVLPQAARVIVPGLGNEFNNMLKTSSLLSVHRRVRAVPGRAGAALAAASSRSRSTSRSRCWYLLLTTVWTLVQVQLERQLGRAATGARTSAGTRAASASGSAVRDVRMSRIGPAECRVVRARDVRQALRPQRGAARRVARRAAGRGGLPHRPVGLGQDHLPALPATCSSASTAARSRSTASRSAPRAARTARCDHCGAATSPAQRAQIGFVFQRFNLWPHTTALQNIVEGPRPVHGVAAGGGGRDAPRSCSRKVGLAGQARRLPAHAVGRAAAARGDRSRARDEAALMLFDEPTSALDPETVGEVLERHARARAARA